MNTNKLWGQSSNKKRILTKNKTKSILIVCEGAKTELNYFKKFPFTGKKVVIGTGKSNISLVNHAINEWKGCHNDIRNPRTFDTIWCVFDRDINALNPICKQQFNSALSLAKNKNKISGYEVAIKIAYTIDAFELWYLLHYNYFNTGLSRNDYMIKLNNLVKGGYKKNSDKMYGILENLEKTSKGRLGVKFAIKNAERLLKNYTTKHNFNNDPSTTVHLLVKELMKD